MPSEIRVFVAEDEGPARRKLLRFLAAEPDFEVVGEASDGPSACEGIERTNPDLVFLDIRMPHLSGIEVASKLPAYPTGPGVVFLTAHTEFALDAFGVHALDYLLKPFDASRFQALLNRMRRLLRPHRDLAAKLETLLSQAPPEAPRYLRRLMIRESDRAFFLPVEQIDRIESARNYVNIHSLGRTYVQRGSLESLAKRLDPAVFARVNRSNVVRLDWIEELRPWFHGEYQVVLRDKTELTWSRRFRSPSPDRT